MSKTTAVHEPAAEPTDEELSEQTQVRLAKRARLIESGAEAYPVSLPITTTIPAVRAKYPNLETDAATGVTVGLAGRVVHLRNTGKLCFATLQAGDGARIQAMVSLAEVGRGVARRLEGSRRPRRPRLRLRRGHLEPPRRTERAGQRVADRGQGAACRCRTCTPS